MHPQSPPLTIGGTVLKEFDNLVILGVTFDSMCYKGKNKFLSKNNSDTSLIKTEGINIEY